jgi:hypothetical protein
MQLDIIVPVIMGCSLLWWVGRGMNWTARLVVAVITLVVIVGIVLFERSGF